MKKIDTIIETIRIKIRRKYIHLTAKIRRNKICNEDFTIISNNCWAGFIYQSYGIRYNTPTIGMFIMSEDYIKFISNLKHYLEIKKMTFIKPEESKWYTYLKNLPHTGKYPIAKLDEIELHFLHYKDEKKAQEDWDRRKKRVNYNKILYKFSEMNLCNEDLIKEFQLLDLKNKICFITDKYKKLENEFTVIVSKKDKEALNSSEEPFGCNRYININNIINGL